MGKKALSGRENWQDESGKKAAVAEQNLYEVFDAAFYGTDYRLHKKPKHLSDLYASVALPPGVLKEIYDPPVDLSAKKWGVAPDFGIENTRTGKILFGEIKRQDGWVEGKLPSDGRGNVHERACKWFTPGLLKAARNAGGIYSEDTLPFWIVFQGDVTRDPKRVREIALWFDTYKDNFFMWRPTMSGFHLLDHFTKKLKKHLD